MANEKKALLVKMDPEMHKRLKMKTVERGENMTTVVLELIEKYLAGDEPQKENAEEK